MFTHRRQRLLSSILSVAAVLAIASCAAISARAATGDDSPARPSTPADRDTANEQKMGKEDSEAVEKSVKMDTNKADNARVARIGARLAAVANRIATPAGYGSDRLSKFDYTYKIIDDKQVNAFSIPGGHIYIYKGMLDLIKTDDELAGVLGHETAHAAHHHVMALTKQANKMSTESMLAYVAAILSHSADAMNAAAFGQYLGEAQLNNRYSESAEEDADHTGMIYMQKAGFSPVGMLTMLQRLKDLEDRSPTVELGFLRDHPLTEDRVASAKSELASLGVTLNEAALREASGTLRVALVSGGAAQPVRLTLGDQTVCVLASDSRPEAEAAETALNKILNQNLQLYEVKADGNALIVRGQTLLRVSPADAAAASAIAASASAATPPAHGSRRKPDASPAADVSSAPSAPQTPEAMASGAAQAIRRALWQQTVGGVGGS